MAGTYHELLQSIQNTCDQCDGACRYTLLSDHKDVTLPKGCAASAQIIQKNSADALGE